MYDADEGYADEGYDDDYLDEDDDAAADTIDCPYCGESIFDDAPSCPHCGNYITDEDLPARPKPAWFVVAAWLCLLGASTWFYFLWAR